MKKGIIFTISIMLLVVGSIYIAGTYAKYTSTVTGSGTATVAKWAFDTANPTQTIGVALGKTYDADTLVNGRIAPGTEGSFNIALSNVGTEVGVEASITINATGVPTNMKFYSDAEHATEINLANPLTVTLAPNAASANTSIYWAWAYETAEGDTADTADGKAATSGGMDIDVTIVGTQVTPVAES